MRDEVKGKKCAVREARDARAGRGAEARLPAARDRDDQAHPDAASAPMTGGGSIRKFGLVAVVVLAACHHVQFGDIAHTIRATKHDTPIVTVIDGNTLGKTISFRSGTAFWLHRYDVKPGVMLKQMADAELPQMFAHYEAVTAAPPPTAGNRPVTLVLTVPQYRFSGFHATATVHATAYAPNGKRLFDKDYTQAGDSQSGKMVWGGAYAIPSAVRNSTYDAYERIMVDLRQDLDRALQPQVRADASPEGGSIEGRLRALKQLRANGLISEHEYEAKRRELLDRM